ncbi:MAG: YbjN domain-containing protein [Candidatus Latescibacterota bacterium]
MADHFAQVLGFATELGLVITRQIPEEEILIVDDEERGVQSLVIDCEDEVLVLEQLIMVLADGSAPVLRRILQMNRELVHGAFALDESGSRLLFRDTLALEHLDLNELEGSINALSLGLAEHGGELLTFAKQ